MLVRDDQDELCGIDIARVYLDHCSVAGCYSKGVSTSFNGEGDFSRALASRLTDLRIRSKASQVTLAGELKVDQGAVSRVESGQRRLSVGEAFAWLEALGLDAEDSAAELCSLWKTHGVRPPGFWRDRQRD